MYYYHLYNCTVPSCYKRMWANTAVIWIWSCLYSHPLNSGLFTAIGSSIFRISVCHSWFQGGLEINLPSDKLLQNIPFLHIRLAEKVHPTPITGARTVFLDGSGKTIRAAITWEEDKNWRSFVSSGHSYTQSAELFTAIMALQQWPQEPLNIVCELRVYCLYYSVSRSGINSDFYWPQST